MLLDVHDLQASYGSSKVLFGVDLQIEDGQVVSLLGRNGMGKTTTVRNIVGLMRPTGGSISFANTDIRRLATHRIARLGIGLVPEGRQIFPKLTVRENLIATAIPKDSRGSDGWDLPKVEAQFPILKERASQGAGHLSGGEQQMLAIGRALMMNPKLLILDEATEGIAPLIRQEIWTALRRLGQSGLAILLIDKNVNEFKDIVQRHFIMAKGKTVWSGTTPEFDAESDMVDRFLHL